MRAIVNHDGDVLTLCPGAEPLLVELWRAYCSLVVAAPYDDDDPYACEIGGES